MPGRKATRLETPLEKKEREKKKISFSERYEEELKAKLFEEELKKKEDAEDSPYYETERVFAHKKRNGTWDVPLDEKIEYFDPELSYELTGYRPINETQGFDFDPTPFCEVGMIYDRDGKFTAFPKGTKPYVDFWNEQKRRCVEGYTIGKYRITGDHYFFLNFYRMSTPKLDLESSKLTTGRSQSFPTFLSKQYEFFHYFEMCEMLGKDVVMLKARGLN